MTDQEPVTAKHEERRRRSRKRIIVVLVVVAVLAVALTLAYGGRIAWLRLGASEGDVPPASSLSLLPGSEVISEEITCGSGGCTAIYEVRPPEGKSVEELGEKFTETNTTGTFLDSRFVWYSAEPRGHVLVITTGYERIE